MLLPLPKQTPVAPAGALHLAQPFASPLQPVDLSAQLLRLQTVHPLLEFGNACLRRLNRRTELLLSLLKLFH